MGNDGGEIGVAHFIETIPLSEWVGLDFKVVVIGDTLDARFGIVAALTVLIVEMPSQSLLVSESNFFEQSWQQSYWGPITRDYAP